MSATADLAVLFVHECTLNRYSAATVNGPGWADDEPFTGLVSFGIRLVRNVTGDEVVSTAQVAAPRSLGVVRAQSTVTLPAELAGRTRTVIGCEVGDGAGILDLPEHVVIFLE